MILLILYGESERNCDKVPAGLFTERLEQPVHVCFCRPEHSHFPRCRSLRWPRGFGQLMPYGRWPSVWFIVYIVDKM